MTLISRLLRALLRRIDPDVTYTAEVPHSLLRWVADTDTHLAADFMFSGQTNAEIVTHVVPLRHQNVGGMQLVLNSLHNRLSDLNAGYIPRSLGAVMLPDGDLLVVARCFTNSPVESSQLERSAWSFVTTMTNQAREQHDL